MKTLKQIEVHKKNIESYQKDIQALEQEVNNEKDQLNKDYQELVVSAKLKKLISYILKLINKKRHIKQK